MLDILGANLGYAFAAVGIFLLLAAAVGDARTYLIPNKLNLCLLALGLLWGIANYPHFDWLSHLGWGALVFAVGFGLFAVGFLGGGDVKMLAVLAFWAGGELLLPFLFITAVAGGFLSVFVLVSHWFKDRQKSNSDAPAAVRGSILKRLLAQAVVVQAASVGSASPSSAKETHKPKMLSVKVPYGIAIAVGGVYLFVRITGHLE